ncbi:MAG: hypothetical protein H6779_01870 [Candidatus Nomurabacteria bacterium]|nr:hypothetical protein [Candidatus Nomurabacteria bacterium]USN88172.1 MAG: hypothetical protein H6779_01870 [Candidatus Nomurabacteria bacterium]
MEYSIFSSLQSAFMDMWASLIQFLPTIVVAIIVIAVGVMVASGIKKVVEKLFSRTGIDTALDAAGVSEVTKRMGFEEGAGAFIAVLVKWFVLLVFFIVALDILRLDEVTTFLREVVVDYLPRVIVAVLILMVAAVVGRIAKKAIVASTESAGMSRPDLFGKIAYVAIITMAVLAALNQLNIASELIQPLFTGIVFAISLALGLAFGLGGKEAASRVIDSITKR